MRAMVLERTGPAEDHRLVERDVPVPEPGPSDVLIRVTANGVCRTDLHVVEGELPDPVLPLIPGHQIVGVVERAGEKVTGISAGMRVGVPWLGSTCGHCVYCRTGNENLCDEARFTGYQLNGGYAEYAVADAGFVFALPDGYGDVEVAPLLCAGLIGFRALRLAAPEGLEAPARLGIYGFGAAAHIVTQIAIDRDIEIYAFTRGEAGQRFARELGAVWTGTGADTPPKRLDAAIIFAPAGELVPAALRAVRKGGTVVTGGIHMSEIPAFAYEILWGERTLRSVANLTRRDGETFLEIAPRIPVRVATTTYPLELANEALIALKRGELRGAAVLKP